MPVMPWYRGRARPKRCAIAGLADDACTSGIRLCGTCAGIAPRVTTTCAPVCCATSTMRSVNRRHA